MDRLSASLGCRHPSGKESDKRHGIGGKTSPGDATGTYGGADKHLNKYPTGTRIDRIFPMAQSTPTAHIPSTDQAIDQRNPSSSRGLLADTLLDEEEGLKQAKKVPNNKGLQRLVLLLGLAALILGWWISSIVLKSTRPRW